MNWTKETPTKDGYYWLRRDNNKDKIVNVYDIRMGLGEFEAMVSFTGSDMCKSLCDMGNCQWSLIEEPKE